MFRRFLRFRAPWILLGLAVAVLLSGGAIRRYWVGRTELARLESTRVEMIRKVRSLEARQKRAENDEMFIETTARRELGLLAPDEIEFRFVTRVSTSGSRPLN